MNKYQGLSPLQKIPTGVEGFEQISKGGLIEGRTTLVVGSSGSGKTIFGIEFLYRGITNFDRPGVFVTLEEAGVDIVRNVKSLDWHLDDLIAQKKLRIIDASPEPIPIEEAGIYELEGLMVQIKHAVQEIQAKLVVIDSIGSLFHQFHNIALIRREIFRIIDMLRGLEVTALLTAERLEEYGPISRHGIEEFVSDNVIVLRNVLHAEKARRTIQILKMRGATHLYDESPFTINQTGLSVLPLSAIELRQSSSSQRVSFGNPELDQMTDGGIFHDSIILVSGPTGGGKTLLSSIFTAAACRQGEKVLLLAYEESREQLIRNAQAWGIEFEKWETEGLLKVICQYPESRGLEDHLLMIQREIASFRPRRMVVDSISALERVSGDRHFREFVIGLTSFAKQETVCGLFTSSTPKLAGGESITETHISTITDLIILLRYVEINGILRRGIAVIKMRGSQHEKEIREFVIDRHGLHIGQPFKNVQNIILGIPSSYGPSESEQLGALFDE